jgi:anti-repressor protein
MSYLFNGQNVEVMVKGEDILFNVADVATALGFTREMNGKPYIRWERVNEYLSGSCPQVGKDDFIPEKLVYKLIFKAKNETAEIFTDWLAGEVLPSIRKTGGFVQDNREEEFISKMFPSFSDDVKKAMVLDLHKQKQALELQNAEMSEELAVVAPKAEYYDFFMERDSLVNVRDAAKQLGIKERAFTAFLVDKNYCYRDRRNKLRPHAQYNDVAFVLKDINNDFYSGQQMLITAKGKDLLRKRLIKEGLLQKAQ